MEYKTKLFLFSKVFEYPESLNTDVDVYINPTDLEIEWHKYWREHGDHIVKSSWTTLYSDYILENSKYIDTIGNLNLNSDTTEKSAAIEILDNTETEWQNLWDQHYQYEYFNDFELFSQSFYQAQRYFQLNKELNSEIIDISDQFVNANAIDEWKELKALGLPTSFTSSSNYYKYHQKNCESEAENSQESGQEDVDEMNEDIADGLIKTEEDEIKKSRKRKTKKRSLRKIPSYLREDKSLMKYWRKRFQLFSRFDDGIKLDKESWFSVTPEKIAKSIADKMSQCDIVIDGFCGSGGNSIQLAMKCKKVIAIDIDPIKIEMAKHNAKIYKVDKNIEFIIGDFLQLCNNLKADGICLSTPWGGPSYLKHSVYDIEKFLQPLPASELLERCRKVTENIVMFIPKNSNKEQIIKLAGVGKQVEIVQNYLDNRLVAFSCYFGNLIKSK